MSAWSFMAFKIWTGSVFSVVSVWFHLLAIYMDKLILSLLWIYIFIFQNCTDAGKSTCCVIEGSETCVVPLSEALLWSIMYRYRLHSIIYYHGEISAEGKESVQNLRMEQLTQLMVSKNSLACGPSYIIIHCHYCGRGLLCFTLITAWRCVWILKKGGGQGGKSVLGGTSDILPPLGLDISLWVNIS